MPVRSKDTNGTDLLIHGSANTMRAVYWEGKPFHVSVKSVPRPILVQKEDAIVRVTSAAICGSTCIHIGGL